MTRCILYKRELPKKLWVEATNIAVFLLNKLPTKVMQKKKNLFGAWFGYKLDLQHLRTFGCLCFPYVSQAKKGKLDKKVELRVFIGYSSSSKAYRIFQP